MELDEHQPTMIEADEAKTTVTGAVSGASEEMLHDDTFYFVGRAKVEDIHFPRKKGVTTRKHVAVMDKSTVIDRALAIDLIEEDEERSTGQMRLLDSEGEVRRAGRKAVAAALQYEGTEQAGEFWPVDEEAGATSVKEAARAVVDLTSDKRVLDMTRLAYLEEVEDLFAETAARALAGIVWARQQAHELLADERREQAAKTVTVDGNGTALTPEEVAAAQGVEPAKVDTMAPEDITLDPPVDESEPQPVGS